MPIDAAGGAVGAGAAAGAARGGAASQVAAGARRGVSRRLSRSMSRRWLPSASLGHAHHGDAVGLLHVMLGAIGLGAKNLGAVGCLTAGGRVRCRVRVGVSFRVSVGSLPWIKGSSAKLLSTITGALGSPSPEGVGVNIQWSRPRAIVRPLRWG